MQLAPHGKTTMSPQLFGAQLANGAWGITLANAIQVQVAHRFGVRRVLLANQLVARSDVRACCSCCMTIPTSNASCWPIRWPACARLAEEVAAHPLCAAVAGAGRTGPVGQARRLPHAEKRR